MTETVYDDALCCIEIVPNLVMPGTYWVVLDGDDETAQIAMSHGEALDIADEVREEFEADNGLFGVGA